MPTPNLEVVRLQPDHKDSWNGFVDNNRAGSPLQLWEWGDVKASPHWTPLRVAVLKKDTLAGTAQILARKLFKDFRLLYCPRGPTIKWVSPHSMAVLKLITDYIHREFADPKTLFLRIEPKVSDDFARPFLQAGYQHYFKSIQPSHTSIINLTPSLEDIIYRMDKDTRYGIRRAAREGVTVYFDEGEDVGLWKNFYEIYQETAAGNFVPRPWRQFKRIFQIMAPKEQAVLALSVLPATPEGEREDLPHRRVQQFPPGAKIIAGAVLLKTNITGAYLWGGSSINEQTKNLYGPYLLQWEIIRYLKSKKVNQYDLWGVAPSDDPDHAWSGHTLFKKGFGGERFDYAGCFDQPLSPLYPIYKTADFIRQKFIRPDLIENNR